VTCKALNQEAKKWRTNLAIQTNIIEFFAQQATFHKDRPGDVFFTAEQALAEMAAVVKTAVAFVEKLRWKPTGIELRGSLSLLLHVWEGAEGSCTHVSACDQREGEAVELVSRGLHCRWGRGSLELYR
jgi:hypothetical protein